MARPTFSVGNALIVPLLDAQLDLDATEAAPGVPPAVLAAEQTGVSVAQGIIRLPVICHLVRSVGRLVLVDTGVGRSPQSGWPRGVLDRRLRSMGVRPEEIDLVVNTHMHADHVGWNTVAGRDRSVNASFPRARYLFERAEWDHWMRPERMARPGSEHLAVRVGRLAELDRVELVDGEVAITPELSFVSTPGHTPGHAAIGILSAGQRALIVGDATHYQAQLAHPDWSPAWDEDARTAARTRAGVFESLARDPAAALFTTHWPWPGAGRVLKVKGRRVFRAL